jgi:hypothetical protein
MAKKKPVKKSGSSKSHLKHVKLNPVKPLAVVATNYEKWIST